MQSNPTLTGIRWRKSSYSSDQGGSCVECAPLGVLAWRKSSHSSDQGGNCVECAPVGALEWSKSSYSSDQGGDCIEIAEAPCATVAVRDSKNPTGPVVTLAPATFTAFLNWTATAAG
ncbi:DUF397 domain-containing protein [Streptomyces sp. HUAS TT20]|uniref:DUF397 domain-containing protein n=1 Tax=Streptomyces sp. HUAS TT20 TaxID=3447509 RepID=UPI0021DAA014|nr:DUF397 domain-containing protein [Streptomyces sp. HUAS 15-9]UXY27284.1 DUF397 domain-containing protein [Streptomyces sp. HUAS 15-9]